MHKIPMAEAPANPPSCSLSGVKPLLRTRDVLAIVPFGKSKLHTEIKAGRFVAPVRASRRMALYRREDVEAYLDRLISGAEPNQNV